MNVIISANMIVSMNVIMIVSMNVIMIMRMNMNMSNCVSVILCLIVSLCSGVTVYKQ